MHVFLETWSLIQIAAVGSCDTISGNSKLHKMFIVGNLWRELWETSKPVPAVKQAPLFDEDLAV